MACLKKLVHPKMWLLVMMVVVLGWVQGELVDIKPYHSLIVERHNRLRRTVSPQASDMTKIMWDDSLAREAGKWANSCQYERPPRDRCDCGSNLAYQRNYVQSWDSIRSNIKSGLRTWARERRHFQYGPGCGMACSYVQMICSSTVRIGCAMQKCAGMRVGDITEDYSTLFVCFYGPRSQITETYPYQTGHNCTTCPVDYSCSDGLCVKRNGMVSALYAQDSVSVELAPSRPRMAGMSADGLTRNEAHFLTQAQNTLRTRNNSPALQWDAELQLWANWIVSCDVDYPGPAHAYTSFYRCPDNKPIYEVVYSWVKEGPDANIQLDKGCRTPYDRSQCNHYTNMMEPRLTSMACSAHNCGDGNRQLVCIYDNPADRI